MSGSAQAERRAAQLRKLTGVSRAFTYARVAEEVLELTVDRAAELLEADKVVVMLSGEDGVMAVRASRGVDAAALAALPGSLDDPAIERIRALLGSGDGEAFLGVPLVVGGEVSGLLAVARRRADADPDDDEWLLSALADQAAVALEKTRLDETALFRERLMGIVGHDLRNPIQAITMSAEFLLMSGTIGEPETKAVRRISRSAARMTHMIDQLLDFTRARLGGGIVLARRPGDVARVCAQVVDEIAVGNPAADLRFAAAGPAPGVWDRERLGQVFSNLVKNALQHGDPQRPVQARCRSEDARVVVEIHNCGVPIPPALLPRLFDPFRQGPPRSGASTSMGLGLYIADQIVRAHGGQIEVVSTAEAGTTFTVTLPTSASD